MDETPATAAPEPAPPAELPPEAAPPAEPPPELPPFTPVAADQRIEALDVVRGFALLGIFLMNIEWFNRPITTLNDGMPRDLAGVDWLASWFIAYFVQGKFWTIFSLLFGMGFAVMLVRAERAGRAFTQVYLRRILALAVFGAVHYIYVWEGDILFSYAVAALALLILLYGRTKPILIGMAVLIGLGCIPDADPFLGVAGGLAAVALLALYLRSEKRLAWRGVSLPVFSFILLLAGASISIAAVVFWLLPNGPLEPREPLSVFGPLLLVVGVLSWKYHQPAEKRSLRLAVTLYIFFGVAMTSMGLLLKFAPDPLAEVSAVADKPVATAPAPSVNAGADQPAPSADAAADRPKTRAERVAKLRAERDQRLRERAEKVAEEIKIFTTGTYVQAVLWRARAFPEKAAGDAGFSVVLLAMFLIGVWFVRSGVMEDTKRHLPFFRKLTLYALPAGIGIGLLTGFIALSHTAGDRHDGWVITRGLLTLGNLPACLGYVGLVVTMLHSRGALSRIRMLAPLGRMALTNYILQSLICMVVFYAPGLGYWGLPRAQQVLFVLGVYAAQVAFSHWWLARFRYGPLEWVWRGFTYRNTPPMRIESPPAAVATPTS